MAQVAAESGDYKAVVLDHFKEVLPLLAHQVFGGHFAVSGVDLNALSADFNGFFQCSGNVHPEGIENDTNGELIHKNAPF